MKNLTKKIMIVCACFIFLIGCSDFDEINTNPDGITSATPEMLAAKLLLNITRDDLKITKGFMWPFMTDKYILWSELPEGLQYNDLGRTDFDDMPRLIDVQKMIDLTADMEEGKKNSYTALGHFIRAYYFFNISMKLGDIPYSDALKGEIEGAMKPTYDTQKQVFMGVLDELDKADQLFANGSDFEGDMVYGGDVRKWRKMVNSFELKVLINLYKKAEDTDLQVTQRFNEIVKNRPIFENNQDNFSLVYSNQEGQKYPFYEEGNQYTIYPVVSDLLIDKLKELKDHRLFYYAEPSPIKLENGLSESDYKAYVGVDPAIVYSELSAISSSKDYSDINDRYKKNPEGEPVYLLSYAQLEFILAEATVRGWISGNTEEHYNKGITGAMSFVRNNTPEGSNFDHGVPLSDGYIENYLEKPEVLLGSSTEQQIKQIITQKYLSTFLQAPLNAYFEQRRTGYPEFPLNSVTNENIPSDKLPVRWMYPSDEVDYNKKNLDEAVNRQYNGNDDNNGVMWILE